MLASISAGYGFEVERGPDWLLVRVHSDDYGELSQAPEHLDDELWELALRHFTYRLVLVLDLVPHMEDGAIEQLTRLSHRLHEHDGMLRICGLSPKNRLAMARLGLDDLCLDYDTWEEAVLGNHGPRMPR